MPPRPFLALLTEGGECPASSQRCAKRKLPRRKRSFQSVYCWRRMERVEPENISRHAGPAVQVSDETPREKNHHRLTVEGLLTCKGLIESQTLDPDA